MIKTLDILCSVAMIGILLALMQFGIVRQCDTFGKFFYWHVIYSCRIDNMAPEMLHNLTVVELIRYADNQKELTPLERELLAQLTEKVSLYEKPVRKN